MTVELKRALLDVLEKAVRDANGTAIRAGYTGKDGPDTPPLGETGLSVAQIMFFHEFGLGVPERSTVRAGVAAARAEVKGAALRAAKALLNGADPRQAMSEPGEVIVKAIRDRIAGGVSPPLDEDTLNNPEQDHVLPLDDREILAAINWRLDR